MNQNYFKMPYNERASSGFLGPFILGGITGGLVSPYFYRPYNPSFYPSRPNYPNRPNPYPNYPPYYFRPY